MKPMTVLARIRHGQEPALREVLTEINADMSGNPYWRLPESQLTHFARLVIVSEPADDQRLLFSSDHDGTLEEYIAEMVRISPGLERIWSTCEGYDRNEDFTWFIRRNLQRGQDSFAGFPNQTVQEVRAQAALRQQIECFADQTEPARLRQFLDLVSKLASPPSPWSVLKRRLEARAAARYESVRQVVLAGSLRLAKAYGQMGMATQFPRVPNTQFDPVERRRYLRQITSLEGAEDKYTQNQMTLVADIKPGILTQLRLRFAMLLAAYVITYGWPPGEFSGVFTLHSFHWIVTENGKRLLFLSNFDGSAENYLGDFLDKLEWGLNVFYNNCVGYPPGGMSQVYDFYDWIRTHELPPQVYYSAYPETVMNILRDQQITRPMRNNFDRGQTERWLQLL